MGAGDRNSTPSLLRRGVVGRHHPPRTPSTTPHVSIDASDFVRSTASGAVETGSVTAASRTLSRSLLSPSKIVYNRTSSPGQSWSPIGPSSRKKTTKNLHWMNHFYRKTDTLQQKLAITLENVNVVVIRQYARVFSIPVYVNVA